MTIQDHGIGIPQEDLENIFDPYFTTKQQGSGLGLSVANSVIEKHNGCIIVDSNPGIGTTFVIYLKVVRTGAPEEEPKQPSLKLGGGRVLVMDDEAVILRLVSRMLEKMGFSVAIAHTGEEAILRYREALDSGYAYDAVILDLTVPGGMGGKETIQTLLKLDPDVKAIVSSGYSGDPVMSDFSVHGFRQAVGKPYQIQELNEALHSVLQQ